MIQSHNPIRGSDMISQESNQNIGRKINLIILGIYAKIISSKETELQNPHSRSNVLPLNLTFQSNSLGPGQQSRGTASIVMVVPLRGRFH
jgi:hypothetical protein